MTRARLLRSGAALGLLVAAGVVAWWHASEPEPGPRYVPDRRDYQAFRAIHPDVLEPNYLPFMLHRAPARDGRGDHLFFCRWPAAVMPLPVFVEVPAIAPELQDEFDPKDARIYVDAVLRAMATWEDELEGLVGFRRVEAERDALLTLRLIGEDAPALEPDLQVLGITPISRGCRVIGEDTDTDALEVAFEVPEVRLYLADQFGLLSADQVEWIALHEIGHALGMRTHSPIPADLMYEVVRDRVRVRGLSIEDVNSFVTLYQLPNGMRFGRVPPGGSDARRPPPEPPVGEPRLAMAPYVDARHGFELLPPAGWMRVETARGMVTVDGATWDYTASFQLVVHSYSTIEAYLERYGGYYRAQGSVLEHAEEVVSGRRALRVVIEATDGVSIEENTFIEVGDGRLFVVIADSPADQIDAYRPWFRATLDSLRIWDRPHRPDPSERRGEPPPG